MYPPILPALLGRNQGRFFSGQRVGYEYYVPFAFSVNTFAANFNANPTLRASVRTRNNVVLTIRNFHFRLTTNAAKWNLDEEGVQYALRRNVLLYIYIYTHVVGHEHDGRTAHVAHHSVYDIDPAAEEVRRVPRQGHGGLVHEVDGQVLRRRRRFCGTKNTQNRKIVVERIIMIIEAAEHLTRQT